MKSNAMKSNPLVSVIVPCYNYGQHVEKAIQSVLEQTYKNVELIVINDGSTDNSGEVISRLQKEHKFNYVSQENQGIIKTRNKGVKLAQGEYIIQLDADDWLDPAYIEGTIEYSLSNKVEIVYTQANIFGRTNFVTQYPEFNLEYLKHDGFMNASALMHKSVFKNREYDVYLNDKGNEDWDLFLDACLDGVRAGLLDKPLLYYQKHEIKKSRADKFAGTKNEILVRHHVLNKQNAKHPEKMWYFSPYIELLKSQIDKDEEFKDLRTRLDRAEKRLNKYENFPLIKVVLWFAGKTR